MPFTDKNVFKFKHRWVLFFNKRQNSYAPFCLFCRVDIFSLNLISERVCLQLMFHGQNKELHPFPMKSSSELPIKPSVALKTYLEETEQNTEQNWRGSKYLSQKPTSLTGNVKPLKRLNKTQISMLKRHINGLQLSL